MNTAIFAGYLGRDAELRNTPTSDVLNFSLAVTTGYGDKKKTLWVACALWGERGAKLEQYLIKGQGVVVHGDVDFRIYDKRDGSTGCELTVNVQRLTLIGKGTGDGVRQQERETAISKAPAADEAFNKAPAADEDFNDEIPF